MRHLLLIAYWLWIAAYYIHRYYRFMLKHQQPTAGITTLLSGEK